MGMLQLIGAVPPSPTVSTAKGHSHLAEPLTVRLHVYLGEGRVPQPEYRPLSSTA